MRPSRKFIRNCVGALIFLGVAAFFTRVFVANWSALQARQFEPDYLLLGASGTTLVLLALLSTYCWQRTINTLSGESKLEFVASFAALNSSSLTKYIPGKVVTYALQMYWLSAAGIRPALVVYSNLSSMAISIAARTIMGLSLLAFVTSPPLSWVVVSLLALVTVIDIAAVAAHNRALRTFMPWVRKLLRRDVQHLEVPVKLLVEIHVIQFACAALSIAFIYLTYLGLVHRSATGTEGVFVIASELLADTAGALAVVTPAGLGVKEAVMYWILKGASGELFAVVLPLASRAVAMIVEGLLGGLALLLVRRFHAVPSPEPAD